LLGNALKYTPAGGRIEAGVEADGHAARLVVADTGVGFTPAEAAQLFDRFYRSDAAAVQAEPGSGLGLAIVRAVVEAHGGRVAAESTGPGRGARFVVRLPLDGAVGGG